MHVNGSPAKVPCMKSHKDSDAISITASEEEVQNLLDGFNGGGLHRNLTDEGAEDNDEILKELTATFRPKCPTNGGGKSSSKTKLKPLEQI